MAEVNPTSRWQAADYSRHGRFVADHAEAVLALLAPRPGEEILDVGCGDGALTLRIAAAGADVVGIDASPQLVAAAQAAGVAAVLGDAQHMAYDQQFDAVFSNAALHWMLAADEVASRMFTALRPGGRLAAEFGGFGNIAALRTALAAVMARHGFADADPGQYYPTAGAYRHVLAAAGFVDIHAELIPRQTQLPGSMSDWMRTFRQGFLDAGGVPVQTQATIIDQACALLEPALHDVDSGHWYADYVRLRVTAVRPPGEPAAGHQAG